MTRSYSELVRLNTFEERYEYLKLNGTVGRPTFGHERYINQRFYTSSQWKSARSKVIARDFGRDLGVEDHEIYDQIIIHHMNPMSPLDIHHGDSAILDTEFLISTTLQTHNAIHYGDASLLRQPFVERRPGDTKSW